MTDDSINESGVESPAAAQTAGNEPYKRHDHSIDEVIVDGQFNSEGFSLSAYDGNGDLLDETWLTWAEIEQAKERAESDLTFEINV